MAATSSANRLPVAESLAFVLRVGLGIVFLFACVGKIRQPYDFLAQVYDYELLGRNAGLLVALGLPWVELTVGVCLLAGVLIRGALLASLACCLVFVSVQASALFRGLSIGCACFSTLDGGMVSYSTLGRSGVLFVCAVIAYGMSMHRRARPFSSV